VRAQRMTVLPEIIPNITENYYIYIDISLRIFIIIAVLICRKLLFNAEAMGSFKLREKQTRHDSRQSRGKYAW